MQSTHFEKAYIAHLQNTTTQAEELSIRADPSIISLFSQQLALCYIKFFDID